MMSRTSTTKNAIMPQEGPRNYWWIDDELSQDSRFVSHNDELNFLPLSTWCAPTPSHESLEPSTSTACPQAKYHWQLKTWKWRTWSPLPVNYLSSVFNAFFYHLCKLDGKRLRLVRCSSLRVKSIFLTPTTTRRRTYGGLTALDNELSFALYTDKASLATSLGYGISAVCILLLVLISRGM